MSFGSIISVSFRGRRSTSRMSWWEVMGADSRWFLASTLNVKHTEPRGVMIHSSKTLIWLTASGIIGHDNTVAEAETASIDLLLRPATFGLCSDAASTAHRLFLPYPMSKDYSKNEFRTENPGKKTTISEQYGIWHVLSTPEGLREKYRRLFLESPKALPSLYKLLRDIYCLSPMQFILFSSFQIWTGCQEAVKMHFSSQVLRMVCVFMRP